MDMQDMILVSVDDHIVEPPDVFKFHVPHQYASQAPFVTLDPNGEQCWSFEGSILPARMGLNAVVGRDKAEYGMEPTRFEQLRKGCYDVHARIEDMNVNGVLGSLCFPSFPGFAGETWLKHTKDKNLALVMLKAYNDWHLYEWCNAYPGRFIPTAPVPLWDVQLAAQEAKRWARMGGLAISFTENPAYHNLPSFHSGYWDPLWKTCIDENLAVAMHFGTGASMTFASPESPIDAGITTMPIGMANVVADLVFSPVLRQFPSLRIALSEGGIGWIPFMKERLDYVYDHHHQWTYQEFGNKRPSDYVRQNMLTCFIDDKFGLQNRHAIGVEMISWECDFPHSDCTWPHGPEVLWEGMKELPDMDINAITHENAMRFFNYDPFKVLERADCTVGALRRKAVNVDLSPMKGLGGRKPSAQERRPVSAADIAKQLQVGSSLKKANQS